ncbi:MAG: exonuclease domain-containing protein [Ruthenibacterium lactatiformans]
MTELAVLDFETTGLVPGQDEVLQVAVVDETGAVLMNEYCRPQRHTAWADAQKVNGIAPQDVCGKPPFEALVPRLQEILSGARRVVAYNDGFEKAFLDAYGIPSRAALGRTHGRFCTADGRAEAKPFRRRVVFRL